MRIDLGVFLVMSAALMGTLGGCASSCPEGFGNVGGICVEMPAGDPMADGGVTMNDGGPGPDAGVAVQEDGGAPIEADGGAPMGPDAGPPRVPVVRLSVDPAFLRVEQGYSESSRLLVDRDGYAGELTIEAVGAPRGLDVERVVLARGTSIAELLVSASPTLEGGPFSVGPREW
jgi:hypothetical protein